MIKQIIKQIWNEKRSNAWLWAELLLVFVALWFIVDWGYVHLYSYNQPLGFNIENTYQLTFAELTPQSKDYIPREQKTTSDGEDYLAVMERLRHHPDIEYVAFTQHSSPYNGSNSGGSLRHDTLSTAGHRRRCTPDFFNVFQYQNIDGTGSNSLAEAFGPQKLILPSNFWVKQFPEPKDLLGATFYQNNDTTTAYTVAAVTTPVSYSDFQSGEAWNWHYYAQYIGDDWIANNVSGSDYVYYEVCVRVRPGTSPDFADKLIKDSQRLYNVGNCYIQGIQSFQDIRQDFQLDTVNNIKKRAFIMLFLLINIFLGIIGTFWYRTQQRRAELGLRIALGSSRTKLNLMLISEGVMLLLMIFIPAIIIAYNIGRAEVSDAWQMYWGMRRFIPGVCITFVLIALMIIAGIWYPAWQAMKIEPAEALRAE